MNKGFLVNEMNTSISEHQAPSVTLYPNPTNGLLTINGSENASNNQQVWITDASGKIVFDQSRVRSNNAWMLNLESLDPGFYVLRFQNGNQFETKQFIRE
ncbi:MAG: T9SS type A sorting domain-containing protein [Flavobacteriales bacterium]